MEEPGRGGRAQVSSRAGWCRSDAADGTVGPGTSTGHRSRWPRPLQGHNVNGPAAQRASGRSRRRSATRPAYRSSRSSPSRARSTADGWIVATTSGASSARSTTPCWRVTLNAGPSMACAAVAPSSPIASGPRRLELGFDPGPAGRDLAAARPFMEAPLAAGCRAPFEMLDDVGHEHTLSIQAGIDERAIQELPGGTDERAARGVLEVARLLPDEHDTRHQPDLRRTPSGSLAPRVRTRGSPMRLLRARRGRRSRACRREGGLGADGGICESRVAGVLDHLDLRRSGWAHHGHRRVIGPLRCLAAP